jgi:hypothetical protein
MKKRLNSVFFGVCFLAALLAETYSFIVLKGDLLNSIGFGLVVLITGYLLFSELRNSFYDKKSKLTYYVDHIIFEELETLKSRLNDSSNVQKATYSATKKSTEIIKEELEEIRNHLDALESNNSSALYLIAELQRRSLEGQKKALNIELNYNRESTKQLLEALQSEGKYSEVEQKLDKIITLLEQKDELLWDLNVETLKNQKRSNNPDFVDEAAVTAEKIEDNKVTDEMDQEYPITEDTTENFNEPDGFEQDDFSQQDDEKIDDIQVEPEEDKTEFDMVQGDMSEENLTEEEVEETNSSTILPLYDDPNKALSADEIAALFESYGK